MPRHTDPSANNALGTTAYQRCLACGSNVRCVFRVKHPDYRPKGTIPACSARHPD